MYYMSKKEEEAVEVVGSWKYKTFMDFPWGKNGYLLVLELKKGGRFKNKAGNSDYVLCIGYSMYKYKKPNININEIEKAVLGENNISEQLNIHTSYDKYNILVWDLIPIAETIELKIDKDTLIIKKDGYEYKKIKKLDSINDAYEMINEIVKKYKKITNDAVIKHRENHKSIMEHYGWKNEDYTIALKESEEYYDCWKADNVIYMLERHSLVSKKEKLKSINIDDILFYKVYNQKDTVVDVHGGGGHISGGGSNIGGALLGGALAGPTGAIIGSRTAVKGTIDSVSTSTRTVDNSFIVLKTKTETIELEISSLKALEALIPEKDYDRIEQSKENNTVIDAQVDEIAEIKKYKALLDEGIITEEEFEKKKKKIMGI